ncbi:UNVERIFIED_ORG: hypothetical protein J2X79_004272 [Arthrobacter globiformis]|nr:hypothetical protein [Arthrobacter globiformis]
MAGDVGPLAGRRGLGTAAESRVRAGTGSGASAEVGDWVDRVSIG